MLSALPLPHVPVAVVKGAKLALRFADVLQRRFAVAAAVEKSSDSPAEEV
jgi:hypothetical protein